MSAVLPAITQVAVAQSTVRAGCAVHFQPSYGDAWAQRADFLLRVSETAFMALRDAEYDPIAEAERMAIQGDPGGHRQAIFQHEMMAGLLAGAGNPRWDLQASARTDGPTPVTPTFCFPCGALVPDGQRIWSGARGWCCTVCAGGDA